MKRKIFHWDIAEIEKTKPVFRWSSISSTLQNFVKRFFCLILYFLDDFFFCCITIVRTVLGVLDLSLYIIALCDAVFVILNCEKCDCNWFHCFRNRKIHQFEIYRCFLIDTFNAHSRKCEIVTVHFFFSCKRVVLYPSCGVERPNYIVTVSVSLPWKGYR